MKPKSKLGQYKKQEAFGGWTRIDLLLQLYSRAIETINQAKAAILSGDMLEYGNQMLAAQKTILAIHSGLKPDEHDVAFNVARLLHFVLNCLSEKKFDDAIKVLSELRNGFQEIADEANRLESQGEIPAMLTGIDQVRATV